MWGCRRTIVRQLNQLLDCSGGTLSRALIPRKVTLIQQQWGLPSTYIAARNSSGTGEILISSVITNESKAIIRNAAVNIDVLAKFRNWALENRGESEDTQTESFKVLLTSVCADELIGHAEYKTGELYVAVLECVHRTVQSDAIRELLLTFLQHQPFISLGFISKHAVDNDLPWLQEAVKEKIVASLSHINSGYEIVSAFKYLKLGLISKEHSLILESRTKGCLDNMKATHIIAILHTLAIIKYRSLDLIAALMYELSKKPTAINEKQLTNLFFSCATLMMTSQRSLSCMEVLSSSVLNSSSTMDNQHIISLITSIGKLKWNNPSLIETLCSKIKKPQHLPVQAFTNVLFTCSITGALPDNIRSALVPQLKVASKLTQHTWSYLNMVWSLLVFDIKSEALCRDILSDLRISTLTTAGDRMPEYTVLANCSKLLNIAAVAKMEYNMDFPKLLKSVSKKGPSVNLSRCHIDVGYMLAEGLACDSALLERGVWFPTGHIIDFRYLYDTKEKKIVSPGRYISPLDVEIDNKEQPADHMKWVAVLVNSFESMTIGFSGNNPPEGRRKLANSQLQQMGYHVVIIGETEFLSDPDRARKLVWLKEKIAISDGEGEV